MIELLSDGVRASSCKEITDHCDRIFFENTLEHAADELAHALNGFERYVPDKTVADDDVAEIGGQIPALTVADEIQARLPQHIECLLLHLCTLVFLAAVIQQRHARICISEQVLRINRTHCSKLHKHFRRSLGIGARITNDKGVVQRDDGSKNRTADAADASEHQRRAGKQRARIPAGNKRITPALLEQPDGNCHRAVVVFLHHGAGRVVHLDDGVGVFNLNVQPLRFQVFQFVLDDRTISDKQQGSPRAACARHGAANDDAAAVVGAHNVNDDSMAHLVSLQPQFSS